MNATVNVVLFKSKTLANGEHPLMLRICKDNKKKYKSLKISLDAKYWDFDKNSPRRNCPDRHQIQKLIAEKTKEYSDKILEYNVHQKNYTATALLQSESNKLTLKTLDDIFQSIILGLKDNGKLGNAKVYRETYNSLIRYTQLSELDFYFSEITIDWLSSYEKWMLESGNKPTTISLRFRTLRSVFSKAIEMRCASNEDYLFDNFKVSRFNTKTEKRAITKEEIRIIAGLDLRNATYLIRFSRDIFIFSYLHGGINLTDIANLKRENLHNNRIRYIRQKTGQSINVPLSDVGVQIIERFTSKDSNYIFPILNEIAHKTAQQQFNRIHKYIGHINRHLKDIAKMANIEANLTTYVARHSYATVLKRSGVNTSIISESLGHSSEKVTQIYLDSFENSQIDEAMKNLL